MFFVVFFKFEDTFKFLIKFTSLSYRQSEPEFFYVLHRCLLNLCTHQTLMMA